MALPKFKSGDRVRVVRPHVMLGWVGLRPNMLGALGTIKGRAIVPEFNGEPGYFVAVKHPMSGRVITPELPESMLEGAK